jgi:hypothetical protein
VTYEQILIEPILTEKANAMRDEGKYVFKVSPSATKIRSRKRCADCSMCIPSRAPLWWSVEAEAGPVQVRIYLDLEEGCRSSRER